MNIKKYLFAVSTVMLTLGLTSCSKDDDASSTAMSVNAVYLENASSSTSNHDRLVEFARLGQLIRIEGTGFSGLKKIFINGYDTYFNNALLTDNNVWVTLNKNTPVEKADPAVRNTIRLYKNDDNYVDHPLEIRAAAPVITHFLNSLPQPGETVIAYGENLQETTSVTLPSGTIITDIENDPDGEWFSFTMPSGETLGGAITSVGANGTAISAACFNNYNGMILDFDATGTQGYWGWKEEGSMINGDDLVNDPLNSGRGMVCQLIPQRLIDAGGAGTGSRKTEVWTSGSEDFAAYCIDFDATTPVTDLAFQFDIYVPDEWDKTGQIQITLINNINFDGYGSDEVKGTKNITYAWVPWLNEDGSTTPFQTTGWQTVTIPLSKFSVFATEIAKGENPTFQEVLDLRNSNDNKNCGMGFVNTDVKLSEEQVYEASKCSQLIYVDNFRIIPNVTTTVSDFDD